MHEKAKSSIIKFEMNTLEHLFSSLNFPTLQEGIGTAAGVLVEPIPGCDERFCVAVVGSMPNGQNGAKVTVNRRITNALVGGDLAKSLMSLAQHSCQDFLRYVGNSENLELWQPPFEGMFLTAWREFNADEIQILLEQASLIFSTLAHSGDPADPPAEEFIAPRASEEENFKRAVREIVFSSAPDLMNCFDTKISAMGGGSVPFEVDYLSSSLTACFSTINPRSPRKHLLAKHHAALWRIARSRDFGLFKPIAAELIVWAPAPGLPIFSASDYEIANEIKMELVQEARKEDIQVVPLFSESLAAAHVVKRERELAVST